MGSQPLTGGLQIIPQNNFIILKKKAARKWIKQSLHDKDMVIKTVLLVDMT
mgnify:CR=1 FL=1